MATQLMNDVMIIEGDLTSNTSTPQTSIGAKAIAHSGREFRYAKAGGANLVPGTLLQCAAEATGLENLTPTDTAIGSTTLTTSSTVTVTANQLAGGWVNVTVTPGQGYQYKIRSHPAATSAAVTLTLEDPIQVALTAAGSKIDLIPSPYNGVIINPASASGIPVGVAVYPITAAYYGWIQTKGPANVLADGAITVGTVLAASNGTNGAVEPFAGVQIPVGTAITGISTTEYGSVNLTLN